VLALVASLSPQLAFAADLGEDRFPWEPSIWDGILSDGVPRACEDPEILAMISDRFRHGALMVLHEPTLRISNFNDIREQRDQYFLDDSQIARRFCQAMVILSDGHQRPIWYLIEDGTGYAGIGDNVEFCVLGLDRWLIYNGACRTLRPGVL
jgi:hypothetical protein